MAKPAEKSCFNLSMAAVSTTSINSEDIADLESIAKDEALVMVTTQKDAVKLAPEFGEKVVVLPVKLAFEDEKEFVEFVEFS